jgi:arylamine N-acetyltransferase
MALDLAGYFGRINYRGAAEPNLEVLQGLVTAHTQSIPFENLDPLAHLARRRKPAHGGKPTP